MADELEISEPHLFDILKQPVYVGDVCLTILGQRSQSNGRYDAMAPIVIKSILPLKQSVHCRVIFQEAESNSDYQIMIMKSESDGCDQFMMAAINSLRSITPNSL